MCYEAENASLIPRQNYGRDPNSGDRAGARAPLATRPCRGFASVHLSLPRTETEADPRVLPPNICTHCNTRVRYLLFGTFYVQVNGTLRARAPLFGIQQTQCRSDISPLTSLASQRAPLPLFPLLETVMLGGTSPASLLTLGGTDLEKVET